jgi:hypothetical protein
MDHGARLKLPIEGALGQGLIAKGLYLAIDHLDFAKEITIQFRIITFMHPGQFPVFVLGPGFLLTHAMLAQRNHFS